MLAKCEILSSFGGAAIEREYPQPAKFVGGILKSTETGIEIPQNKESEIHTFGKGKSSKFSS